MSTFVYSTQINLDGPWLIDRPALQQLAEIINVISDKFSSASEECINVELPKMLERYRPESRASVQEESREILARKYNLTRKITLSLSNSRYIETEKIEELFSKPELLDELPTGFEAEIKAAHRSVTIKFDKGFFSDKVRLNIRTSPETDELARVAFVELQQWAVTNQAPLWQRIWVNYFGFGMTLWFLALFFSIFVMASTADIIQQDLRPVAIQILKDGISNEEIPKAIELLLRIEFKEPIAKHEQVTQTWFIFLLFGGLAAIIVLWFRPSLEIGVGRSVARIKRWRGWIQFVSVTLPGFFFLSIIWPYLSSLVKISP